MKSPASRLHAAYPHPNCRLTDDRQGFRSNRGCRDALRRVRELLEAGHIWAVDADLKSCFDTIPHGQMVRRAEEKVSDGRVIETLQSYLKIDVMDGMESRTPEGGAPQGAIVSPLSSLS